MQIHTSPTSPYSRKVAILVALADLPSVEWVVSKPLETPALRSLNPLGKIPVLVDGDQTLYDSSLICEYLDDCHMRSGGRSFFGKGSADYYVWQQYHYLANGLLDAAVAMVMEGRREPAQRSPFWMARWQIAVEAAVAAIPPAILGEDRQLNIAGIATACALGYLAFRLPQISVATLNPSLHQWYGQLAAQAWFAASTPCDPV